MSKKELGLLILFLVSWRITLFVLGFIAPTFIAYRPSFPYAEILLAPSGLPQWLYSWANFDGVHYLTIAEKGYVGTGLIQAFFPLYPLLVKTVGYLIPNLVLTSIVVSDVAALALGISWFTLIKSQYSSKLAWLSLLVLFLFPTSFFLVAGYSESLFLTLVLLSFYWAGKKHWTRAIVAAALASATRIVGIFVVIGLMVEMWSQTQFKTTYFRQQFFEFFKKKWLKLFCVGLGSGGLVMYMSYLHLEFGDPLYFLHVQSEFGANRSESLVLFPQVIWRYIKILATARPIDTKYLSYIQDFFLSLLVPLLLFLGIKKGIPYSWLLFSAGAFIIPTLTGTFSSMPRYVLVCFPIYITIALYLEGKKLRTIGYFLISGILLVINTLLFIQGYWVA